MNLKKYSKIYKVFVENGISYVTQYRHDNWLNILVHVLWLGMLFLTIEIIFGQTNAILGWSKQEVYLLTVFWSMVDEVFVIIFNGNLPRIPDVVTDGKLDLILVKPVSTLFMVSTNFFLFRGVYRLITVLFVLGWLFWHFDYGFTIWHWPLFIILALGSIMVQYAVYLIINTLSFWFLRINNINDAVRSFEVMGRFPFNVFPKTIKIIFFTVLPIAFNAYVPMSIALNRWPWYGILYAFVFVIFIFSLSIKFWHFAVKRYSSASS